MLKRRTEFKLISERILYGLVVLYSDFEPCESTYVESTYQKDWYLKMRNMLYNVYENPSLMNLPMDKDDYFRLHQCNNEKPELIKIYKKAMKIITNYYKFLYYSGLYGVIDDDELKIERDVFKNYKVTIKPSFLTLLQEEGISVIKTKSTFIFKSAKNSAVLKAWKLLSERVTNVNEQEKKYTKNTRKLDFILLKFACCSFSNDLTYWIKRVEKLYDLEKGFFKRYENLLLEKGYCKQLEVEFNHNSLCLAYRVEGEVSGFSVSYHFHRVEQFYFSVLNCIGSKAILEDFEKLDVNIQDYMMKSCRRCFKCNRCTKGGKYKRLAVPVVINDKQVELCSDYPRSEWTSIDDASMSTLIDYIDLQSKYGKQWRK